MLIRAIKRTINTINNFDKVTRFRLINAFFVAWGLNLFWPIIIDLKGEYLLAWMISGFMILETIMVKTNRYVVENFSLETVFRASVIFHFLFTVTACTYFISPYFMIITESILAIVDVVVFSAYSMMLTTYLTKNYPDSMEEFQILRNGLWADGTLIGLSIITLITMFASISYGIIAFIGFNICFSGWLLYNWNFYKQKLKGIKT